MYCGKLLCTAVSFPDKQLDRARSIQSGDSDDMVIAVGPAVGLCPGYPSQKRSAAHLAQPGCSALFHARSLGRVRPREKNRWNSRIGIERFFVLRTPALLTRSPEIEQSIRHQIPHQPITSLTRGTVNRLCLWKDSESSRSSTAIKPARLRSARCKI